jgi:hypothetical protein
LCGQAIGYPEGRDVKFVRDQFALYCSSLLVPEKFDYIEQ